MSIRYPESEWYIKDGVRYRKEAIDIEKSKVVAKKETKAKPAKEPEGEAKDEKDN